jgi:hypothetical protein
MFGRFSIIVAYAICLHLIQATALTIEPAVGGVTSVFTVMELFHDRLITVAALAGVAALAVAGMFVRSRLVALALMLPQQFMLFLGASGVIHAIQTSRFADGVYRPGWFLFADQMPIVLAAAGHVIGLIAVWRYRDRQP